MEQGKYMVNDKAISEFLKSFFEKKNLWEKLRAEARTQAVTWRWATESMSYEMPFARELYGGSNPRWIADDRANPKSHVRHGLDAQERIVIECGPGIQETVWLYEVDRRTGVQWYVHNDDVRIGSVTQYCYQDGRLAANHLHMGYRGSDTRMEYGDDRLLRSFSRHWQKEDEPWYSQYVFCYNAQDQLERIVLQYTDAQGQPTGQERLIYLRLPKGESLTTVEARVKSLLLQAIETALANIPQDEKLYCLLLCYTHEDLGAAWPPFLVWGRESYRRSVVERDEDVSYYLWAPDEIRDVQGEDHEYWFDDQELREACLLHAQLMDMRQSNTSAMRVLKQLAPEVLRMAKKAGLPMTDDFVVAFADNTGEVDPLKAMKSGLDAEHWALLKQRGYV
ncbi:hypothetical protein J31TS6_40940 [Brevibacillus reuszeri]|uniref:hypothetical protein n=1 Tax=Brevibacillus reuszeri TaxID=54915 RepID=UPI001AFF2EF4|nr:hypothetical protein [Brevibacillus reuszeri]GIO08066.1 hypothetical protein J31TS6_40940 [Brevibacillus reuszeri]